MKAKLLINGKELEVEISEEELKKLEVKKKKKTGYERVEFKEPYYYVDAFGELHVVYKNTTYEDDTLVAIGNCYSDETVAENNARADKLMRQLRRFAVEHREKEINWIGNQHKYYIKFDYDINSLVIDTNVCFRNFGSIAFDSEETAELAAEGFEDELLWYFTEYEDSL